MKKSFFSYFYLWKGAFVHTINSGDFLAVEINTLSANNEEI